ncbi:hypothetical protein BDW22DRAFT_482876 [Trametopsis cervina]|nr:hypothetical protein BDW22DRAFT_482876 [Trametopsis cervina]
MALAGGNPPVSRLSSGHPASSVAAIHDLYNDHRRARSRDRGTWKTAHPHLGPYTHQQKTSHHALRGRSDELQSRDLSIGHHLTTIRRGEASGRIEEVPRRGGAIQNSGPRRTARKGDGLRVGRPEERRSLIAGYCVVAIPCGWWWLSTELGWCCVLRRDEWVGSSSRCRRPRTPIAGQRTPCVGSTKASTSTSRTGLGNELALQRSWSWSWTAAIDRHPSHICSYLSARC